MFPSFRVKRSGIEKSHPFFVGDFSATVEMTVNYNVSFAFLLHKKSRLDADGFFFK